MEKRRTGDADRRPMLDAHRSIVIESRIVLACSLSASSLRSASAFTALCKATEGYPYPLNARFCRKHVRRTWRAQRHRNSNTTKIIFGERLSGRVTLIRQEYSRRGHGGERSWIVCACRKRALGSLSRIQYVRVMDSRSTRNERTAERTNRVPRPRAFMLPIALFDSSCIDKSWLPAWSS